MSNIKVGDNVTFSPEAKLGRSTWKVIGIDHPEMVPRCVEVEHNDGRLTWARIEYARIKVKR